MTERVVSLDGPDSPDLAEKLMRNQGGTSVDSIASSIPNFTKVRYDTFVAEYNLDNDNVVVHFFLPKRRVTERYWKSMFADALNDVGQDHFQATAPRLVARYTEELHSWWFRAQGYGHIIDLETFVENFFVKLDLRMGPSLQTQSKTS